MKLLIICLTIFVCGCAPLQPHIPGYHYTDKAWYTGKPKVIWVWIDNNFDTFDKINITEAMALWNKSLNGYIELKPILPDGFQTQPEHPGTGDWTITKVPPGDSSLPQVQDGWRVLGAADKVGGTQMYLAKDAMEVADVYFVTLHEIGHLLGAEHRGEKLMYHQFNRERFHCIDFLTANQVGDWNNIPVAKMNYCMRY